MANTANKLFRGAAATSSTPLYTVPAATTTVVTNIAVCNTSSSAQTATITLDGSQILGTTNVNANSTIVVDLKQTMAATEVIAGLASATSVVFHISGMEIS
jgi:hypothetical protein